MMNQLFKSALGVILFLLVSLSLPAQLSKITSKELQQHIGYLASDSLKGRYPGTSGDRAAASYIQDQFQRAGLTMPFERGLQAFDISMGMEPGPDSFFHFADEEFVYGDDFQPVHFSASSGHLGEVVYLGYGIRVDHEVLTWDDYHGIDVSGKWVMVLRGKPQIKNSRGVLDPISEDFGKSVFAKDMGAAGVLLIAADSADDELDDFTGLSGDVGIPVIQITRSAADQLLRKKNESIRNLIAYHSRHLKPHSFHLDVELNASVDLRERNIETYNVIGLLKSQHPQVGEEYIVVGAHYDHLGMGTSGSRRPGLTAVHYGADDNASGVAALIELAGKIAQEKKNIHRSIIFAAFGAEEKGLLGSKHFVANPPVPLSQIKLMVNLDMIGRLKEDNSIQIGGTGTAIEMEDLLEKALSGHDFDLTKFPEGLGPSDHASFYGQDIPVLFVSTGPHLDYHTPDDTPDKINYEGLKMISDAMADLLLNASQQAQMLSFTEAGPKVPVARHGAQRRVSLGLMPDFTSRDIEGLRADFITEGKSAHRAGMKDGDIITAINGLPVKNIEEYMFRLSQLEPGQTIHVEVLRNDEKIVFLVVLD
jgi:aminopeptidase YwaD